MQLEAIQEYVFTCFQGDATGHDFNHMKRVAMMARNIAISSHANPFTCEVAGWLHDIGDRKLFSNPDDAIVQMNEFLISISFEREQVNDINNIINMISFQKGKVPRSLEGKIVQDADRLDAIGAIGIARTFQYGGAHNQMIYNKEQDNTSIQHFYDKLLKIKDKLHTEEAKRIAEERHEFMEKFLNQFYREWNGYTSV